MNSIFTWTPATAYLTYNAWLGQLFFYLIDEYAGVKGLITVRFCVYSLIFLLGWSYAIKRGIARNPLTWVIILVSLALVVPSFTVKPSLLSLSIMTITVWLYFYIRSTGDPARYLVYIFPLILMIWVNVHGGFIISSPFFILVGIGEFLNRKFSPRLSMPPVLQRHFFLALLMCGVAIFITPYGYKLPLDIIKLVLVQDVSFIGRIAEYNPTFVVNTPPHYLLDYLILAMFIFIFLIWQQLKNRKIDWVVILVFITYCSLFTQMARLTSFLGPVFLFVGLDLLAYKEASWAWPNSRVKKFLLTVVCIIIFTLFGWRVISNNSCIRVQDKFSRMFDVSSYVVSVEAEYIANNLQGERVGNLYNDGGYLIYKLWPEKLVMIDPRYFPFEKWIKDYFEQFINAKDIAKFIKKYPADFWLIRYQEQLVYQWFFNSAEWELLFQGPQAGIFVQKSVGIVETIISPNITKLHNIKGITNAVQSNLDMNKLDIVHLLHKTALKNLNQNCSNNKYFTNEIGRTLDAYEAFSAGNYKQAVGQLSKRRAYFRTSKKAVSAYMHIAEQAFESESYYEARNLIKKAFALLPVKFMTDIYNMAVTDWHYRHYNKETSHIVDDDLLWQNLVQMIIDNERFISKDNPNILNTANAMLEGSYDGNAHLLPRYKE
jgi:hypothetical protein